MPAFDLQRAEELFQDILDEHAALSVEAKGFGLRLAALPRGLMPLADAQRVVVDFTSNTTKLRTFLGTLYGVRDIPSELRDDMGALQAKAAKALKKFEDDLKQAQDAIAKYEDLLVGEHFQEAFEAVRHAVLDFDLADDVDIDFKTDLSLDTNPAYGVGSVILKKGTAKAYVLTIGYRAVDDFYWGSIESGKRYKTFKNIVTKTGRTKLPKFVRELVEQVKALDDTDATGVFRSRKKVELTIEDPAQVAAELTQLIEAHLKSAKTGLKEVTWSTRVGVEGGTGSGAVAFNGWGWDFPAPMNDEFLSSKFRSLVAERDRMAAPFTVTTAKATWRVTPVVQNWTVTLRENGQGWSGVNVTTEADITKLVDTKFPERSSNKRTLDQWRTIARARGIDPAPMGRSPSQIERALQLQNKGFNSIRQSYTLRFNMVRESSRTAAQRVADAYFQNRTAGACGFDNYVDGADPKKAFREAVEESRYMKGHDSYSGTINEKHSYEIRSRDPMTRSQAYDFAHKDMDKNDKWGPAFAVPVTEERLLKEEKVTVIVEARNDADAVRQGTLRIKATGRIPPKASVTVEKVVVKKTGGGPRVSTYEVTANRKQVVLGETKGWLFYGYASC